MSRFIVLIFVAVFFGCSYSGENNSVKNDAKIISIKYPLPSTSDSLLNLLKTLPDDSNKVNVLNALARSAYWTNEDTSIILATQAYTLAEKLNWKKGMGYSSFWLGWCFYSKGDYSSAMDFDFKAIKLGEEIDDKKIISSANGNLGVLSEEQGEFAKALSYYLAALKMDEEFGNKKGIARNLGNIGIVYKRQGDFIKALEYYFKALKMSEELGDKKLISIWYSDIGIVYKEQGDAVKVKDENYNEKNKLYTLGMDYYFRALKIQLETGNKLGQVNSLGNIGNIYGSQSEFLMYKNSPLRNQLLEQALDYVTKAMKTADEIKNKYLSAIWCGNTGSIYVKMEKYDLGFAYLYRALAVDDSIGAKDYVKNWYLGLSALYEKSSIPLADSVGGTLLSKEQMRLRSLYYYKKFVNLRDTIFSEENKKQIVRKGMNYEFEKKEAATKAENDKKEALAKEQLSQKETQRNYFIAGFGLVLILAGFIFRSYRQKQKANEIISKQKLIVEEKQKEILDSIHYAKRIQQSMMPTEKYIARNFKRLKKS